MKGRGEKNGVLGLSSGKRLKGRMERFDGEEVPKASSFPAFSAAEIESERANPLRSNGSG